MIENAIQAATDAIRFEQEGKDALAIHKYVEAADWLLIVIKGEGDEAKRAALSKRAEEYVMSAERLKRKPKRKMKKAVAPPPPPKQVVGYFTADENFRSDVARAKILVKEADEPFVDSSFGEESWLRPSALGWGDDPFVGTVATPGDVDQGTLGDCWLLSSLSVLAEYPELVRRLLVASSDGIHATRFCYAGEWRLVLIDDRIPCSQNRTPKYAGKGSINGSYWAPLLEKGLAKLFGSYEALDEGTAAEALSLLTGAPTRTLKTSQDLEVFFNELARAQADGFIVAASCGHTERRTLKEYEKFGLRHAHEYALLKVVQVRGVRLLQLRNPWGSGEWRGRWSSGSAEWKNIVLSEEDKGHVKADDGVFFMQLEDFVEFFHEVAICRLRRNFLQTRYDVKIRSGLSSPAPAFLVNGNGLVDVCLLQATERGKIPKGHHVMADISLAVYSKRWEFVAMTRRGMLAPVVDTLFDLQDDQQYIVVPICINWRVLNLAGELKIVFFSSKPIRVEQVDLGPKQLALALRSAVLAKGERAGKEKNDAHVYDLEGIHLAENRSNSKSLSISISLGKSSHLISSRHGGVLGEDKPAGAYKVTDVIPPLSFQLNLFRVPFRQSWSIQGTTLEWSFLNPSSKEDSHEPPIPGVSDNSNLHSIFPVE